MTAKTPNDFTAWRLRAGAMLADSLDDYEETRQSLAAELLEAARTDDGLLVAMCISYATELLSGVVRQVRRDAVRDAQPQPGPWHDHGGGPRPGAGRPRRHRERLVVELRSPDARALEAAAAAIGVTPQVLAARILEASGPVLRLALHHGLGVITEIPPRGEIYPMPWSSDPGTGGEP